MATADSTDIFADKRRELGRARAKIEGEIAALQQKQAEIDRELQAIAAYDEVMGRRTRALQAQADARLRGGPITRDTVFAIVADAGGSGVSRGGIIDALGVKGNKSSHAAVDNRLRELKRGGRVQHKDRMYTVPARPSI